MNSLLERAMLLESARYHQLQAAIASGNIQTIQRRRSDYKAAAVAVHRQFQRRMRLVTVTHPNLKEGELKRRIMAGATLERQEAERN